MYYTWFLLGDADDPAGGSGSSVASGFAQLVPALSEVVRVGVDHHSATNDGVLPGERDHGVSDVELGAASLSSHDVEVRPGTGAAVGVVSELEISRGYFRLVETTFYLVDMETMKTIRETRDLPSDLHWARAILLKVNSPSHLTGTLQNTHGLHHFPTWNCSQE